MESIYDIKAEVVDICIDSPLKTDTFLVDTCAWYWMTSTRTSVPENPRPPIPYQTIYYPKYVKKIMAIGAQLYRCGTSFPELAHLVEKTEYEIYQYCQGAIKLKDYRQIPDERQNVITELNIVWGSVKSFAEPVELIINDDATDEAFTRYKTQPLDGYDLFLLHAAEKAGITKIITDDCDYAMVPGIQVFTANNSILNAAKRQSKLLVR